MSIKSCLETFVVKIRRCYDGDGRSDPICEHTIIYYFRLDNDDDDGSYSFENNIVRLQNEISRY